MIEILLKDFFDFKDETFVDKFLKLKRIGGQVA